DQRNYAQDDGKHKGEKQQAAAQKGGQLRSRPLPRASHQGDAATFGLILWRLIINGKPERCGVWPTAVPRRTVCRISRQASPTSTVSWVLLPNDKAHRPGRTQRQVHSQDQLRQPGPVQRLVRPRCAVELPDASLLCRGGDAAVRVVGRRLPGEFL